METERGESGRERDRGRERESEKVENIKHAVGPRSN